MEAVGNNTTAQVQNRALGIEESETAHAPASTVKSEGGNTVERSADATSTDAAKGGAAEKTEVAKVKERQISGATDELSAKRQEEAKLRQNADDLNAVIGVMYRHGVVSEPHDDVDIQTLRTWCDDDESTKQALMRLTSDATTFDAIIAKGVEKDVKTPQGSTEARKGKMIVRILKFRAEEYGAKAAEIGKQVKAKESEITDLGGKVPPNPNSKGAGASSAGKSDGTEAPRPAASEKPGLEGAAENVARISDWAEQEFNRLSAAYTAETDSSKQAQIKTKLDTLSRQMQVIANMQLQFETMISTIIKLRGDMAMTAVRNMH